jgi:flagellar hook-associated protein 3 FlgL
MAAESRQTDAETRVASQKNGSNLKDYANKAETLTAMNTVNRRLQNYLDQNGYIAAKLDTQDQALTSVADAATQVRQAIMDALSSDNGETLMQRISEQFQNAVSGLNTKYDGKYLFSGGQTGTAAVSATQLSDLTSGPPIASFFHNDQLQVQAKLDDSTTVTTGQLADQLGTSMMNAFQALEAFDQGPGGPINGPLTAAQRTFLTNQVATWQGVATSLTTSAADNGLVQQQVDQVKSNVTTQQNTLVGMIGDVTDANMAQAATDLSNAQLSVQATARVLQSLQSSSLLSLLPIQ